ncbi:MAG: hypothetical protein ACP5NB_06525 [Chloroflexia bacterium]
MKRSPVGPKVGREKGPYQVYLYRGRSMGRTLRPGDLLYVVPASPESVRPGDIVLFRGPGEEESVYLAHRVQARTASGLLTQGDDHPVPDPVPVAAERLLGRVCFREREGRICPVWGGWAGRLWALLLRLRRRALQMAALPYRLLRRSGVVRRFWRPAVERIHLRSGEKEVVKYVHAGRTVACWWPEEGRFWCRRPYDLVLEFPPAPPSGNPSTP